MSQKISIGRIVHYVLSEEDAKRVNRRRTTGNDIAARMGVKIDGRSEWPVGAQAHIGNEAHANEEYPMLVTQVWPSGDVNGQVFLDGTDVLWVTSVQVSDGKSDGKYHWPEQV